MNKKKLGVIEAQPLGRPSLYKPEYCQLLINHMAEGLSFLSFAGVVSVSYDTIHEWVKAHPDFSYAKGIGRAKQLIWDEKLLNRGSEGKQRGYSAAAHKWKMANAHKWTDRVEHTERSPKNMTDDEILQEARAIIESIENKDI